MCLQLLIELKRATFITFFVFLKLFESILRSTETFQKHLAEMYVVFFSRLCCFSSVHHFYVGHKQRRFREPIVFETESLSKSVHVP